MSSFRHFVKDTSWRQPPLLSDAPLTASSVGNSANLFSFCPMKILYTELLADSPVKSQKYLPTEGKEKNDLLTHSPPSATESLSEVLLITSLLNIGMYYKLG